ncbi:MAG TPA: DUF6443 domain-containing protein, partial [Bacteroidales bacterium]|nr:DUF6443 domain-containing protein [Bacteroidales bacterium]
GVGISPSGYDIIQPILYDDLGRETKKTLPYTAAKSGEFRTGIDETDVNTFYNSNKTETTGIDEDGRAYSEIAFDNSPLNRIVAQTGPGTAWQSIPVTIDYIANSTEITGWYVNSNGTFSSFNYPINTLYITETKDEEENIAREYKDKQGKIVQKSVKLASDWLRTAYIYDDLDLLRCVVPPQATDPNTNTALCYYYNYDHRKRMVEKRIPGGGTVKMVYDKRDRLRCTQNSNQAATALKEWSFIKYDELNRPVISGVIKNYTIDASTVQSAIDAATELNETRINTVTYYAYNKASFPKDPLTVDIQSVTWYDDYEFMTGLNDSLKSTMNYPDTYGFATKADLTPKGQVTGTLTFVLSPTADVTAAAVTRLYSASYYDKYGHPLRTISDNVLKGKDVVSTLYEDITYLVQKTKQLHYKEGRLTTIEKSFEYDHAGRLMATREKINAMPEITMNAMKCNELGQLTTKYLHSDQTSGSRNFIQKVDFNYNIRGWLNKINDPALGDNDLFGMQLCYNDVSAMGSLGGTGSFSGNISGLKWQIKNDTKGIRGYSFAYDDLNRLKTTGYAEGASLNTNTGHFTESVSLYDKNGNIKSLQRKYSNVLVDNLTYYYTPNSNQILQISDAGLNNDPKSLEVEDFPENSSNYIYDANGNMTTDGSRNTTLAYHNTLNIPSSVDFGNNNRIFYHYSAGGAKLLKHVDEAAPGTDSYTHYIGNIIYENGRLSYIITEEGRMVNTGTNAAPVFVHEYNLKDHLGNNRVTFLGKNIGGGAIEVMQTMDYYPFGLSMTPPNANPSSDYSENKYLYNGKEIQDDKLNGTFFGMLDYGARFYDPQIGRWHSVDPLAEKYRRWSPYNYCMDNPIR